MSPPFNSNILRKGENLIAVRLVMEHGAGGFIPEHEYFITAGGKKPRFRASGNTILKSAPKENAASVY